MRFRHVVGPVAAGLLVACCGSCKIDLDLSGGAAAQGQQGLSVSNVPDQVIDCAEVMKRDASGLWVVGECGQTDNGIYCLSVLPDHLETWKWDGATLQKDLALDFSGPRALVFLPGGRYLGRMCLGDFGRNGPLVLGSLVPQGLIRQKEQIPGWKFRRTGSSRNTKHVAVGMEEDVFNPPRDYDRERPRVRIGLVDVGTLDIRWIGELTSKEGSVREIAVSQDGEYVAVTGCNNKVALLSASLQKILWNQKPNDWVADYAVFSSDGLKLYVGGVEGCVSAIETRTGKITGRWYATTTGRSIYGHRIACLAVSPDDRWVAAGTGLEGQVYLFDVTGKEKPRMLLHGLTTTEIVSFSPDSQYLASFAGGKIKIWSVAPAPRKPPPAKQLK